MAVSKKEMLERLGDVAASDAAHDFKPSVRNKTFSFKTDIYAIYKKIGTPIDPDDTILDEWEIVFDVLGLKTKEKRDAIFKLPDTNVPELRVNTDDEAGYHVRTRLVAVKNGEERTWKVKGARLVEWLKGDQDELVLTIDAIDVPLHEGFEDPRGGAKVPVKYILSREGIVDGAMKANESMSLTPASQVQVQKIYDTRAENIAYFKTDKTRLEALAPTEYFFSNYTIHIPAVKTVKGIRSTTIEFTNKRQNTQRAKFKSVAEDKNPYTVTKLAEKIGSLISYLTGKATTQRSTAEEEYHMLLQSKRAGDWLQVLACLDPTRFGLPQTTRIRIATVDRICLLYALMMGVDVIYTRTADMPDKTIGYFLTTFYRNNQPQLTAEQRRRIKLQEILDRTTGPISAFGTGKPYMDIADVYIGNLNAFIGQLWGDLLKYYLLIGRISVKYKLYKSSSRTKESDFFTEFSTDETEKKLLHQYGIGSFSPDIFIQTLLKLAMKIAILTTVIPYLGELPPEFIATLIEAKAGRVELPEEIIPIINIYNTNISKINTLISRAGESEVIEPQIITKIRNMCYAGDDSRPLGVTEIVKDKLSIIDKLRIRERLFSPDNFNENGIAILSYINIGVTERVKNLLFRGFVHIRSLIEVRQEIKNYDNLLKLVKILIIPEGQSAAGAFAQAEADVEAGDAQLAAEAAEALAVAEVAPTIEEVPTEQILQSMFHKEAQHALMVGGGAAPAAPDDRFVEISDFFPEQVLLAERMRAGHNVVAVAAAIGEANAPDFLLEGGSGHKRSGTKRTHRKRIPRKQHINPFSHNPLTTFCCILSHLNNALSADYADMSVFHRLSSIVMHMINTSAQMAEQAPSIIDLYRYISSLETFLLEDLETYMPRMGVRSFMASVKEDFYGIDRILNYTPLAPAQAREYVRVRSLGFTPAKQIDMNVVYLAFVIKSAGRIEGRLQEFSTQISLVKTIRSIYIKTRKAPSPIRKRSAGSARSSGTPSPHRTRLNRGSQASIRSHGRVNSTRKMSA